MSFTVKIKNHGEVSYDHDVTLLEIIGDRNPDRKIIAARVNNRIRELTYILKEDAEVEFLTFADPEAMKLYEACLRYVIAMAFSRVYPGLKIRFAYNVSRCVGIHILSKKISANTNMLIRINHEIESIIQADYPLIRHVVKNEEAKEIFEERGFEDKIDLLQYRPEKTVHLYECDGYLDYMYHHMVPSTGYITSYKLRLQAPGLLLQYPRAERKGEIPEFKDAPTFGRTLKESHDWGKTIGSDQVAKINRHIERSGDIEFINICEARHSRMLTELGQLIQDDIDDIALICIAGPSSSGKTTFANRLRIELLSRGIHPIRISLDDYYLPKDRYPIGEDGKPDYESIEALDIELFNQNMVDLINGEEVTLPHYDFQQGKQIPGRTLKLGANEPIIIEGIHALNERMTLDIPKNKKFRIFISPQAQINLDDHNPLSLTDLRLIRRIVRDYQFRGSSAEETLDMWPSVRAGEFRWIYDNQENADYVYNSMLSYELPVLKRYAMPLLLKIDKESPYWPAAARLMSMLKYFIELDEKWIPSNSLLREFIGGSCFADV